MKNNEITQLDQLFQIILLTKYDYNSILGGTADCIHHQIPKSNGLGTRWWKPNGIPLTTEQHNIIHSSDKRAKDFKQTILSVKGNQWAVDLKLRYQKTSSGVKYLTFEKVKSYLNGEIEDYI